MDNKNAALSEERGGGREVEFTENLSRFAAKRERIVQTLPGIQINGTGSLFYVS